MLILPCNLKLTAKHMLIKSGHFGYNNVISGLMALTRLNDIYDAVTVSVCCRPVKSADHTC